MDDDDFDYDEDYGSDISEGEDEDVMREFELDEIRSEISVNPNEAAVKLRAIATEHSSVHSIDAASELMRLRPGVESFLIFINALALAPNDMDSYERLTQLEPKWLLLQSTTSLSDDQVYQAYFRAIEILRASNQTRAYFKALLCLTSSFIDSRQLDQAWTTLQSQFYTEIKQQSSHHQIWTSAMNYDAKILEIEICVSSNPVNLLWLSSCLSIARESGRVAQPTQRLLVNEAQARLDVEMGRLDDAKQLLEKIVRDYEEIQGSKKLEHLLTRSIVFLVLVSTIFGEGSYDPQVEHSLSLNTAKQSVVQNALRIALCFSTTPIASTVPQLFDSLTVVNDWLRQDHWKLGTAAVTNLLGETFVRLQIKHALMPYERLRWDELKSQVKCPPNFQTQEITFEMMSRYILDDTLPAQFRLNLVDRTVDRVNDVDWRRQSTCAELDIPMPQNYIEYQRTQLKKHEESEILNRWKRRTNAGLTNKHESRHSSNDDETYHLLQKTLDAHRDAMSR